MTLNKNKWPKYAKLIELVGGYSNASKILGCTSTTLRSIMSRAGFKLGSIGMRNPKLDKQFLQSLNLDEILGEDDVQYLGEEEDNVEELPTGTVYGRQFIEKELPPKGEVYRYIITSAQNNTDLHPSYVNLIAYKEYLNGLREKSKCEFIVGTYTYNVGSYGKNSVKKGKAKKQSGLWFAKEIVEYIDDRSILLTPTLAWCGELNIDPTAVGIFSGKERYNGRKSNIIPHARLEMKSCPSMADEAVKFNYSTGTITQKNYIQKNRGITAEQQHNYGAVIVEVDHLGNWWVRQLYVANDGSICDIGPDNTRGVKIKDGKIYIKKVLDYVYCGDVHVDEMDLEHKDDMWSEGGFIDQLMPKKQYMGDVFSMARKGHHSINNFHEQYQKWVEGEDNVEDEVEKTANFLKFAYRNRSPIQIVGANHDKHLDIWLNTADYKKDQVNALYFLKLQYQVLAAKKRQDKNFNILEYALREFNIPKNIKFLDQDVSTFENDVACNLHGNLGVNGSRGSTQAYTKASHKINKAHDHTAAILFGVFSAGACAVRMPYMHGLHTHSLSHIVGYENGERAIVTFWDRKFRA